MIDRFKGRWYFLSNFYPCEIKFKGIKYPSVEHYYVAQKFKGTQFYQGHYFTEPDFKELLARVKEASDVKKIGQAMKTRPDWDAVKYDVMIRGVRYKFTKDDNLKQMLINTDSLNLTESNYWHDQYWGDCVCGRRSCFADGENNLGKILMVVRDEITPKPEPSFEDIINKKFWDK